MREMGAEILSSFAFQEFSDFPVEGVEGSGSPERVAAPDGMDESLCAALCLREQKGFFAHMSADDVTEFFRTSRQRTYGAGEIIFAKGEIGRRMFVILSGAVGILTGEDQRWETKLNPGELFGEMALIDHAPRAATAMAIEETKLLSIDGTYLGACNPGMLLKVMCNIARQLSQNLRTADAEIERLQALLHRPTARVV